MHLYGGDEWNCERVLAHAVEEIVIRKVNEEGEE